MQNQEEFRVKREQYAQEIRRNNREEIFAKRRNIDLRTDPEQPESKAKEKNSIVDPRFREQVEEFSKIKFNKDQLLELVHAIYDPDIIKQLYGLVGVRKLLCAKENQPIQQVIDAGLVPKFIAFSRQKEYPQMQLEAIWCLSNIAAGNSTQCSSIIQKGGIEIFVDLLLSEHPGIIEQSIWTLGNIACDLPAYRDSIIRKDGVSNFKKVIEVALGELPKTPAMRDMIETACWALSALCRSHPLPKYAAIKEALPIFFHVLKNKLIKDINIVGNICWAISYYSDRKKETLDKIDKIQALINSGVVPTIVSYLINSYDSLVVAAIRVLGNIATGNDRQLDYLLSQNILEFMHGTLRRNQKTIRKESCWLLSNITAGNAHAVGMVLGRKDLVKDLLNIVSTDLPDIRIEALYALANGTANGNKESLFAFYQEEDIISYFVQIIENGQDSSLLATTYECLGYILELGKLLKGDGKNFFVQQLHMKGVVPKMEEMQYHEDDRVYEAVSKLLCTYFELENTLNL